MKLACLLVFLFPFISQADYVPGRIRPSAEADMDAIKGDGKFENARSARLVELSTDGKGVTHYELTIDDHTYAFVVKKASTGSCGDLYEAQGESSIRLILRDMSLAECEYRAKNQWEAQAISVDNKGRVSHLFIGGNPEHLLITQ